MYSGNLDTSDVLLNRGLNGGFGFGQQGNFLGDGSAVNANTLGNRDLQQTANINRVTTDGFLSNQIDRGDNRLSNQIDRGNNFLTDRINGQSIDFKFQNISDQLASAERLAFANQAATQRDLGEIRLKQTECCCKLEAGQASILAKLDAQSMADLRDSNNRLNTEIQIRNNLVNV